MKLLPNRLIVCTLILLAPQSHAEWIQRATVGLMTNDNATLGGKETDIADSSQAEFAWSAGYQWTSDSGIRLVLSPGLSTQRHANYADLNATRAALDAACIVKLGIGREAPSVRAVVSLGTTYARDRFRDGKDSRLTLRYTWPVSEALDLSVYWLTGRQHMRELSLPNDFIQATGLGTDVFDTHGVEAGLALDVYLTPRWLLLLGVGRRTGDVTSITRPDFTVLANSTALAPDRAFGTNWIAYRIHAVSTIMTLGASYELSRHLSLDLALEHREADSPGGLGYRNTIVRAGLGYVF